MKGRVEVIKELLGAKPDSVHVNLGRGETVLHLSVKYNRLEALKILVEHVQSNGMESLLVSGDDEGNTTLHLAADLKQVDTIEYLLGITSVKDYASDKNQKGFNALDVVEQCPKRNTKDMQIQKLLLQAGVHRSLLGAPESNTESTQDNHPQPPQRCRNITGVIQRLMNWFERAYVEVDPGWFKEIQGHLITTATVTATIAYQAILSPPGGFWQDTKRDHFGPSPAYSPSSGNSDEWHTAGHAILDNDQRKPPFDYALFLNLNTQVLVASFVTVILVLSGLPTKNKHLARLLVFTVYSSISSMASAYCVALSLVSSKNEFHYVYFTLIGVVELILQSVWYLHFLQLTHWIGRKIGKYIHRRRKPTSKASDDSTGEDNQIGQP